MEKVKEEGAAGQSGLSEELREAEVVRKRLREELERREISERTSSSEICELKEKLSGLSEELREAEAVQERLRGELERREISERTHRSEVCELKEKLSVHDAKMQKQMRY